MSQPSLAERKAELEATKAKCRELLTQLETAERNVLVYQRVFDILVVGEFVTAEKIAQARSLVLVCMRND